MLHLRHHNTVSEDYSVPFFTIVDALVFTPLELADSLVDLAPNESLLLLTLPVNSRLDRVQ